jgi:hypothetical protein
MPLLSLDYFKKLIYPFNLIANSINVLIKKDLRNIIAKNAIIGEISMPNFKPEGRILLIG